MKMPRGVVKGWWIAMLAETVVGDARDAVSMLEG
jgi:hypothetical protein